MLDMRTVIALCVLAFLIRAVQNWCNGTKEADRMAYESGSENEYDDAQRGNEHA